MTRTRTYIIHRINTIVPGICHIHIGDRPNQITIDFDALFTIPPHRTAFETVEDALGYLPKLFPDSRIVESIPGADFR
jgi:hypothetical protein